MIVITDNDTKKPNFKGKIFLKTTKMSPEKMEIVKRISSKLKKYIHRENFDLLFYYKLKKGYDPLHVCAQKGHRTNIFTKGIDICMPDLDNITDEDYIEMAKGAIKRYKEFYPKEARTPNEPLLQQMKNKAAKILNRRKYRNI